MVKIRLNHTLVGLVSVLIGYASAGSIIYKAASDLGATQAEISSWFWALGIGMGISTIGLSTHYKQPIVTAWSTPGAALLITDLGKFQMSDAIGTFLFSSMLITFIGASGLFTKLINKIPVSLAAAMLGGVIWPFEMDIFDAAEHNGIIVLIMCITYLVLKPRVGNYLIPIIFIEAIVSGLIINNHQLSSVTLNLTEPVFTLPTFNFEMLISVGIPLFFITMVSQNLPGFAILKYNGYRVKVSKIVTVTGIIGLILAPFGGFAFNLAALTAAICMNPSSERNKHMRYLTATMAGFFYLVAALMGQTIVEIFSAIPKSVVITLAGLALFSVLCESLSGIFKGTEDSEAAIITFVITASGLNLLGIGSAFWGIIIGLFCYILRKYKSVSDKVAIQEVTNPSDVN